MIHDVIERVAYKRHQRLINAGVNEAIADQIVTQDLIALKWQYRGDANMLHDAIERVAYKRHQRLINAGVKESIAARIVTRYLIALKWQYRRDDFTKKIIDGLISGYSADLSDHQT